MNIESAVRLLWKFEQVSRPPHGLGGHYPWTRAMVHSDQQVRLDLSQDTKITVQEIKQNLTKLVNPFYL